MTEGLEEEPQAEEVPQPDPVGSSLSARAQRYGLTEEQAEMLSLYL